MSSETETPPGDIMTEVDDWEQYDEWDIQEEIEITIIQEEYSPLFDNVEWQDAPLPTTWQPGESEPLDWQDLE